MSASQIQIDRQQEANASRAKRSVLLRLVVQIEIVDIVSVARFRRPECRQLIDVVAGVQFATL